MFQNCNRFWCKFFASQDKQRWYIPGALATWQFRNLRSGGNEWFGLLLCPCSYRRILVRNWMCFFRNSTIRNPINSDIVHTIYQWGRVLITDESAPASESCNTGSSPEDLKFKVMSGNLRACGPYSLLGSPMNMTGWRDHAILKSRMSSSDSQS